jgi:hypothetical protein
VTSEGEFWLERRLEFISFTGEFRDGHLKESPCAPVPRAPVRVDLVGQHGGRPRRVGQHHERVGVRLDPHLPDRSHALNRGQLVHHRHRHHRPGVADAGLNPLGQPGGRGGLTPDDPAVIDVEEPCQRDLGAFGAEGKKRLPLRVRQRGNRVRHGGNVSYAESTGEQLMQDVRTGSRSTLSASYRTNERTCPACNV